MMSKTSRLVFVNFVLVLAFAGLTLTAAAQKKLAINQVQGDKNTSPYADQQVRVSGIVTARIAKGFFIQTPDDQTDNNPATSEGVYVYTGNEPGGEAAIGNLVTVSGTVQEYRPKAEPLSLPVTEISMKRNVDTIEVQSKANPLPKPIVLGEDDFSQRALDKLERYEGMRVAVAELTVIAPTGGRVDEKTGDADSNGTFYGVIKGMPRPFRGPGLDIYDYQLLPDKDKDKIKKDFPKIAIFDHNPEILRVESATQLGSQAINVTSFAEIKNLVGVLDYKYRAYDLLVDADNNPAVSKLIKAEPLPAPTERQFSIAGMNIERFFDTEDDPAVKEPIINTEGFERRLKKLSLAVREYLQMPDVIGVTEMESEEVLQKVADRINADAVADGKPNPKYKAFLVEGNDIGGIDSGFMVKTSRVEVLETKQFGKDDKFENPVSKKEVFLNDRPPFMLRAAVKDDKTGKPFEFTVVVNHMKSLRGYDDDKTAPFVRTKKKLQAEFLARWVQERQKAKPSEKIILIGDFNAFQFNDGITDVINTIKGTPAGIDAVMYPSEDLVNPDLVDLVDFKPADQRYSYTYDGNAQTLDHFIINQPMMNYVANFGFVRFNADFPEIYRNDPNRVERFSDHDSTIGYFSLDEVRKSAAK